MRTVTYGAACSLDGFIARPDGGVEWLIWSKDVQEVMREYWKTIDTIVMGRKTYEVARSSGSGAYPGMKNYVCSHTLQPGGEPGVEVVAQDAVPFLRNLKHQAGRGICLMGGGELAQSLLEADLIDEIRLNIHPVILGSGIPLLRPVSHAVSLELYSHRLMEGGCLLANYRVRRNGGARSRSSNSRRAKTADR